MSWLPEFSWLDALPWIFAAVGALGVGGTIAAAIAFPTVVIPLVERIVSAFLKCRPCLIALVFVASIASAFFYGRSVEKAACRADALAAELRNREIDLEIASKSRSDETARANEIAANAEERAKADAEYIAHLKGRGGCLLDDDDMQLAPAGRRKAGSSAGAR